MPPSTTLSTSNATLFLAKRFANFGPTQRKRGRKRPPRRKLKEATAEIRPLELCRDSALKRKSRAIFDRQAELST
jgi:hypothetical protein